MSQTLHLRLNEAKERMYRQQKAERRRDELQKRCRELERRVVQLEVQLEREQHDVEKLTRMSLTNLFHTLLRSKQEQLELERQQVLTAALNLQEAQQTLANTQAELQELGDELAHGRNAKYDYEKLLAEKEAMLRDAPYKAAELADMEEKIGDQSVLVKELNEALVAGKRVLASLEDASNSLEKADNWGKWDTWGGGGMVSTHAKHTHIDDAKQYILNANHQILQFRDELADLKRSITIDIDISSSLKMADYWFDNLITDWIVQGRIHQAQENVLEALSKVRAVTSQLERDHNLAITHLQQLKNGRTAWIEDSQIS
ncbi:hypothetical protein [Paenibacillus sp. GCM10027626]|uniref:hypothetical protein n=1 Tax=Paenibacillus sp. GCM10027626 TaxID=3273411 RepID=UPI00362C0010